MLRTCKKNMCLEKIRCPLVRAPRARGGAPGRRPPATCVKNRGARGKINIKIYGGALYQKRKSPRGTAGGPRELPEGGGTPDVSELAQSANLRWLLIGRDTTPKSVYTGTQILCGDSQRRTSQAQFRQFQTARSPWAAVWRRGGRSCTDWAAPQHTPPLLTRARPPAIRPLL